MEVAVLGGGYAGVASARRLEARLPRSWAITLVDEGGTHLLKHELHRTIRKPTLAEDIRIPLDELVTRSRLVEATISAVDRNSGTVRTVEGAHLEPTFTIVCLGARTATYGIEGVETYGQGCTSLADAVAIRERFCTAVPDGGRVIIVGAGLTGIQVAGELAELRGMESKTVDLTLLEQQDRVAPAFPASFARAVDRALRERDVECCLGTTVRRLGDGRIHTATGREIPFDQLIWAGGIAGHDALDGRRWQVDADLRVGERVFAAGDAAAVVDATGRLAVASAQTAVRQGVQAADNVIRLARAIEDGDRIFEPRLGYYDYEPRGWFVSVGDETVGVLGDRVLTGRPARTAKTSVTLGYLASVGAIERAIEKIGRTLPRIE